MQVTKVDRGSVILKDPQFRDDTFAAPAADTFKAGLILARHSGSLKLIPYVKGGNSNENGIPKAVLTYDIVTEASGDVAVQAMVAGSVKKQRLVIYADGDDANVDKVVCDLLRSYDIVPIDAAQLDALDNIPPEDS